jgi:integrase/recombinase XerC
VHVLGKGGKRRAVPVGTKAIQALAVWNSIRAGVFVASEAINNAVKNDEKSIDKNALFLGRNGTRLSSASVWQRLKRRSMQAGLAVPVHPHMLRHSFASHVLQSSGDLRAVQELLGHSQIATTQVYTRLDFQHLAKAYDAAHPRAKVKLKPS